VLVFVGFGNLASHLLGVRLEKVTLFPRMEECIRIFRQVRMFHLDLNFFKMLYSNSDTEFKILRMSSHL